MVQRLESRSSRCEGTNYCCLSDGAPPHEAPVPAAAAWPAFIHHTLAIATVFSHRFILHPASICEIKSHCLQAPEQLQKNEDQEMEYCFKCRLFILFKFRFSVLLECILFYSSTSAYGSVYANKRPRCGSKIIIIPALITRHNEHLTGNSL